MTALSFVGALTLARLGWRGVGWLLAQPDVARRRRDELARLTHEPPSLEYIRPRITP